jgi:glycosyltransferase involved in cell wall biosynthesis
MIDVILPALDEAAALPTVLAALPAGYRAVVVDNGSTDGTADVAAAAGALVVHEGQRGFGSACWAGLVAARSDVVCFMDADGSLHPGDLPQVVQPVLNGRADLVLAARQAGPGAWPVTARLANRLLTLELRRRLHLQLEDLGPMRAARRSDLLTLGMTDRRSGWPLEMVVLAARAGWRIEETTVPYAPRIGRSKVTGTVRGTVQAATDMRAVLRRCATARPARPQRP